jgi:hypothetical protein
MPMVFSAPPFLSCGYPALGVAFRHPAGPGFHDPPTKTRAMNVPTMPQALNPRQSLGKPVGLGAPA